MTRNIAIFIPSPVGGGAERMMGNLALALSRKDCNVSVIAGCVPEVPIVDVVADAKLYKLNCPRARFALWPLIKTIRLIRPEVLVSTLNYANILCVAACKLSGIKCRLILREANTSSVEKEGLHTLKGRIMFRLQQMVYPLADHVVAVSRGVESDLVDKLGIKSNKVSVIENPAITKRLYCDALALTGHMWIDSPTCPVILSAGRLSPQKDFQSLIAAVSILVKKRSVRLIILGEGDLRGELIDLIESMDLSDCVDLPGYVDNPYAFMSKADVFVMSSRWEGLPNVLIEALACGARVVSTDCPSGPNTILCDGKYGELVPVRDPIAMAEAIEVALERDFDAESQSEWVKQWGDDHIAELYLNLIDEIINTPQDTHCGVRA